MVCIYCGHKTQIINSRPQKRLIRTWRRHACLQCHAVFTTIESPNLYESWRVKCVKGVLSPFERDKLYLSVFESLRHRDDATASATAITDSILARLFASSTSATLTTTCIIQNTVEVLTNFDMAAKVHYAAYHPLSA